MVTRHSARSWLVGGSAVLAMVVASLVLVTMISMAAVTQDVQVQPVPVPTAPLVQQAVSSVPATLSQRPAPAPVPAPPGSAASPQGQANRVPALPLLGLSTFVTLGLATLRWWVGLPAERAVFGAGQAATPCPECG